MFVSSEQRREQLRLWNISEAARLLRLDIGWLHRKIRDSELPGPTFKLGASRYFDVTSFAALKRAVAKLD